MPFDHGHALLIGVGTYACDPAIDVPATADDALALWGVLTSPSACGYPLEQVATLTHAGASRAGILGGLDALARSAPPDSTALLFFSGHGVLLADGSYALAPHDLARDADGHILPGSVIGEAELLQRLRAVRARRLLCIINACHSGELGPQRAPLRSPPPQLSLPLPEQLGAAILATGHGRVIMSACRADQQAYAGDGDLTLLAGALVRALSGDGVPSRHGFIGVYDLYDRAYELVTAQQPDQQPELTVLRGLGPFAVALHQGDQSAAPEEFQAPPAPSRTHALRALTPPEGLGALQELLARLAPRPELRALGEADRPWVAGWLREHWGDESMALRGQLYYPAEHQGFVAERAGKAIGLVTYMVAGRECEILSLDSLSPGQGVGGALVEAVAQAAAAAGCQRLTLVTTNDNLSALGFYQRRGFQLCGLAPGAVEASRAIKPSIPAVGEGGIAIRDEITLERALAGAEP